MLCEISAYLGHSFLGIWLSMNVIMATSIFVSSASVFYYYYWPKNVTYEKWIYKSNTEYPPVEKVRDEIVQTMKGMLCATLCPALSLYLASNGTLGGISKAFCGWGPYGLTYHIFSMAVVLVGSDFYEFAYHRLGHVNFTFWKQHKHHHVFYNPSPFSVIADEWIDQFFRSAPLLLFPLLLPLNIDLMFVMYGIMFYFYGVYLHSGHELSFLSAHNPIVNTSFQHYCHHARSTMNKPFHCGFFVKIWDNLFKCVYPAEKCFCAQCSRAKGERTQEAFKKVRVPEYSLLLKSSIWLDLLPKFLKTA